MADWGQDFDELFAVEYPSILRTVYLVCRDYQLAQDVTQEAFVRALHRWGKVRELDRPGAWIRKVAIRQLQRASRRETVRRQLESKIRTVPTIAHDIDVLDAIRVLSERQRIAVVLFYFEHATLDEIAESLSCSRSTAGVHLHRARARLGSLLKEVDVDDVR